VYKETEKVRARISVRGVLVCPHLDDDRRRLGRRFRYGHAQQEVQPRRRHATAHSAVAHRDWQQRTAPEPQCH